MRYETKHTAAHEAATQSLAKHLATALPLPLVANQAIEWHLKQSAEAKKKLTDRILDYLYRNNHCSCEDSVREALDGFNVTTRGK